MITKNILIIAVIAASATSGCNSEKEQILNKNTTGKTYLCEVSSDDIAFAMGINAFLVKLPVDETGRIMAGFTYNDIKGPHGTGYSEFQSGETVKVLYWIDGDQLKYSLIGKNGSSSSGIAMSELGQFNIMQSCPDRNRVYSCGDIVSKWSKGKSLSWNGGPDSKNHISSSDEIGFSFIVKMK
jgi:hypothetical protein